MRILFVLDEVFNFLLELLYGFILLVEVCQVICGLLLWGYNRIGLASHGSGWGSK